MFFELHQQRATLDELDDEHRSPLLLAAIRGGSRSFCILLEAGSDIQMKGIYSCVNKRQFHDLIYNRVCRQFQKKCTALPGNLRYWSGCCDSRN